MSVWFSILFFVIGVIVVLLLITLHELGHFIFAKVSKAYVFEFSIGFGPRLFTFKTKETWYSIRLLPLGGFVSIASDFAEPPKGREEEFEKIPDERKIDYIKKWKKSIFILAGPFVNLFIAFILILSVFLTYGYNQNDMSFVGQRFSENSVALKALKKNDKLNDITSDSQSVVISEWKLKITTLKNISLNYEEKIKSFKYSDIVSSFSSTLNKATTKVFKNDDNVSSFTLTLSFYKLQDKYSSKLSSGQETATLENDENVINDWNNSKKILVGIQPPYRYFKNNWSALGYSFIETWNQSVSLIVGLGRFFSGNINAISGPIGMFTASKNTASIGTNYVFYIASLSANLFMLNALPFPPLDGYKFWETLIEWITKKELNKKVKTIIYIVGALILLALVIFVTIKDIII